MTLNNYHRQKAPHQGLKWVRIKSSHMLRGLEEVLVQVILLQ
jgi:hypothetical protein